MYVEMVDGSEFDSTTEICGKLDKSNTKLKYRCLLFRWDLFHLKLLQKETVFWVFIFKSLVDGV